MKKTDYKKKSVSELLKEEASLRSDIAKDRLSAAGQAPKDTNMAGKKRKALAIVLTFISEARERAKLQLAAK